MTFLIALRFSETLDTFPRLLIIADAPEISDTFKNFFDIDISDSSHKISDVSEISDTQKVFDTDIFDTFWCF